MEIMAITPMEGDNRTSRNLTDVMISSQHFCCLCLILTGLLLPVTFATAGDWDITPRISLAEVYSDNINLDDNDKEYDLVTDIAVLLHSIG